MLKEKLDDNKPFIEQLVSSIVASFLDFVGVHFGLWYYAGKACRLFQLSFRGIGH